MRIAKEVQFVLLAGWLSGERKTALVWCRVLVLVLIAVLLRGGLLQNLSRSREVSASGLGRRV